MADFIRIHPEDTVAVAIHAVPAGTAWADISARTDIPQGHKMALVPVASGAQIIKYGLSIGHATTDIAPGDWVHTHNMATNLSAEAEYTYQPNLHFPEPVLPDSFLGYRRSDGTVGIRNEIWILPTVGCVNDVARTLAKGNQDLVQGSIDGLYAFPHPFGCSQTGADHAQTKKLLAALARHPNAGAVLVLSLGCENLTQEEFISELGEFDHHRILFLTCQDVADEMESGRALLKQCAAYASRFRREKIPASQLIVGMKCGGSDGLSGITANPLVGRISDILVAMGGSAVLTEVPEMFGAEEVLMNRCISKEVFRKAVDMINGFKQYFLRHGEVIYENPSPGNRAGGITTLEDKSCGCIQKGGSAPVVDVIGYAQHVKIHGLNLLNGPGNDLVSATALAASGAHIILFTTGRGTPFGSPVPTVKIATNTSLAAKKYGWIDFNAGVVADGESTLDDAAATLMERILEVASGKLTKNEEHGYRQIAIFKDGVVL